MSRTLKNVLKGQVAKLGYSGDLLDTPQVSHQTQPGYSDADILNDRYDEGLRCGRHASLHVRLTASSFTHPITL